MMQLKRLFLNISWRHINIIIHNHSSHTTKQRYAHMYALWVPKHVCVYMCVWGAEGSSIGDGCGTQGPSALLLPTALLICSATDLSSFSLHTKPRAHTLNKENSKAGKEESETMKKKKNVLPIRKHLICNSTCYTHVFLRCRRPCHGFFVSVSYY